MINASEPRNDTTRVVDIRDRTRVAIVNDYELVVRGLERMLWPYRDRIDVVELDVQQNPDRAVDVALFDTYGHARLGLDRVRSLARDPHVGAVAIYTWTLTLDQIDAAMSAGARGVLAKSMPGDELAAALVEVAGGHEFVSAGFGRPATQPWPGYDIGLTLRESEVALFLGQGMRNRDIADALWVSENTVKTHLKAIFQKAQVRSRGEAIVRITHDPGFRRKIGRTPVRVVDASGRSGAPRQRFTRTGEVIDSR